MNGETIEVELKDCVDPIKRKKEVYYPAYIEILPTAKFCCCTFILAMSQRFHISVNMGAHEVIGLRRDNDENKTQHPVVEIYCFRNTE